MTDLSLFIIGTIFALIVFAAIALLFWGAVLDGRAEAESRAPKRGDETGQ